MLAENLGDRGRHAALSEEALALFRGLGEAHWTVELLLCLGRAVRKEPDHARARALLDEALNLARTAADAWGIAWATTELAELANDEGDGARAADFLRRAVRLHAEHGDHMGIDLCLLRTAMLAGVGAQPTAAVLLLGAAEAQRAARGALLAPPDRAWQDDYLAGLRARIGEEAFSAAYAVGLALTLEEVVAEATAAAERVAATAASPR